MRQSAGPTYNALITSLILLAISSHKVVFYKRGSLTRNRQIVFSIFRVYRNGYRRAGGGEGLAVASGFWGSKGVKLEPFDV